MTAKTRTTTGTVLGGRYTLLAPIAQGGMGEVWKARDRVTGRIVAAKVLRAELSGQELSLSRLRLEARNAMSIQHPNIANVQDSGEEQGRGWIVMELVEGLPLTHYLRHGSRIDAQDLLPVLIQVAMALDAAASAGVVHRDIKPANVLIREDGIVKLTDFGISRADDQVDLTAAGMVMGTAQYLPPEQAMGEKATTLGDLYALGVIAYEALAGRRPFTGETQVDIAFSHVNDPVPPLGPDVPAPFADVILHLLEKNPAKRPQSGRALVRELASAAKAMGISVEPHPLPLPSLPEGPEGPQDEAAPADPSAVPASISTPAHADLAGVDEPAREGHSSSVPSDSLPPREAPVGEAPVENAPSSDTPAGGPELSTTASAATWAASLPVASAGVNAPPKWRRMSNSQQSFPVPSGESATAPQATQPGDAEVSSVPAATHPGIPRAFPSPPREEPGPDSAPVLSEPAPPSRKAPSPAVQASGEPDPREFDATLDVPEFLSAQHPSADSSTSLPLPKAELPWVKEPAQTPEQAAQDRAKRRAELASRLKERAEARARSAASASPAPVKDVPSARSRPARSSLASSKRAKAPTRTGRAAQQGAVPRQRSASSRLKSTPPTWHSLTQVNTKRVADSVPAPTAYNRSRVAPPLPTGKKVLRAVLVALVILAILAVGGYAIQHIFGSLTSVFSEGPTVLKEVPSWPSPWAAA